MSNQPFFTKDGAHYLPTRAGAGPWDQNSLHGRIIVGLLAHAIEQAHGGADYVPARLTVDMYRLPDFSPVDVIVRPVRDGYRIKVIDAEFVSGGVSAGRATCQLLRRTENPPGHVWSPRNWDVPPPDKIEPPAGWRHPMGRMWTSRPISGGVGSKGPRRTWMSEVRELVEGAPLTPFARAALAADFASPFANAGDQGLGYINTDVTLYLHRQPRGEWIGVEAVNHHATDGIAIGECFFYDLEGPIGSAAVAALAQKRKS